jgi:4-carboxymuconolactone decarboxylase
VATEPDRASNAVNLSESELIMSEKQEAAQNPPTFGRYAEIPTEQLSAEQKDAYDYIMKARGMCPGPYRIWLQNAKLLKAMTPVGVYFQNEMQISKAERELVTNCINGKWATAGYSNREHEELGEHAGLPAEKVAFDDPRQQVIYEITIALIAPRRIPEGLYKRAIALIGDAGLTDLAVLIGYFTSVSMTLAAYDVPAGASDYRPYK